MAGPARPDFRLFIRHRGRLTPASAASGPLNPGPWPPVPAFYRPNIARVIASIGARSVRHPNRRNRAMRIRVRIRSRRRDWQIQARALVRRQRDRRQWRTRPRRIGHIQKSDERPHRPVGHVVQAKHWRLAALNGHCRKYSGRHFHHRDRFTHRRLHHRRRKPNAGQHRRAHRCVVALFMTWFPPESVDIQRPRLLVRFLTHQTKKPDGFRRPAK